MSIDSHRYLERLMEYLMEHERTHAEQRGTLDVDTQASLKIHEGTFCERLAGPNGHVNVLHLYVKHWQFRDFVKTWLNRVQAAPRPKTTYLWFDFGDL